MRTISGQIKNNNRQLADNTRYLVPEKFRNVKRTCHLVQQEQDDMCSWSTRRHFFLLNKNTCVLVQQEYMYSCSTRVHAFLCDPNNVRPEHLHSCSTREHVFPKLWISLWCIGGLTGFQSNGWAVSGRGGPGVPEQCNIYSYLAVAGRASVPRVPQPQILKIPKNVFPSPKSQNVKLFPWRS